LKGVKVILSVFLTGVVILSIFSGCGSNYSNSGTQTTNNGIKEFSVFYAYAGKETPKTNRIKKVIAKKIGAMAIDTYLTGQTAKERIGVMIAGGKYPDFIDGADATESLIQAHALIPIDKYWNKYPNVKNLYSPGDWNKLRQPDGHIYYIRQFGATKGKDTTPVYNDEAFWIQKAVVEWAHYPKLTTLDQYFDLIEKYKAAHPTVDGQPTIGFEINCDGKNNCSFQLENPPQFLAGYPNDGMTIIDSKTLTANSYDTISEAKAYFKKLNEEYNKKIIEPQTFTASYEQYISKISTGRVLGLIDQYWNFKTAEAALLQRGKDDKTYVPFGVTIDPNVKAHYRSLPALDAANGIGITTSCKDPQGALKFLNDLLSPEVETLRNWGVKGVDYEVDSKGIYYRTQKQRDENKNQGWVTDNMCAYENFPGISGTQKDGINAINPSNQIGEFQAGLSDVDKKVLSGYGYKKWTDFMNKPAPKNPPWYPIYSYVYMMKPSDPGLLAYNKIDDIKKQLLPQIIIAKTSDFESNWSSYQQKIKNQRDLQTYEDSLTKEVRRRAKLFK